MTRAAGNDLCEIFGYAPDDTSASARKQWKSQDCPFVGGTCIKHSHPVGGAMVVYGSCSVVNSTRSGKEEVIVCPQRLYADNYKALKTCVADATGSSLPMFSAGEYSALKRARSLPDEYVVLLGRGSGREIMLENRGVIKMSLDWVMARIKDGRLDLVIPCEVQSIDTTGNYHANWHAYSKEVKPVPNSEHGMNWANVWKRLIPQLILKGAIASTSKLCTRGSYFVVPDRVYMQFEKIVGKVGTVTTTGSGVLNVMTYGLGPDVPSGSIRQLVPHRTVRMLTTDFATAFASGRTLPLGSQLDDKVQLVLDSL